MTFGSLFAGIGGFDIGFERAGMECKWQVEIDDYATRVLEKHWPNVHRERDIRECGKHNLEYVDVICGGFPCQDISYAGRGAGLAGERSSLFFEAIRVARELQPRILVLENVAALLTRGMDGVLAALAEYGFDAEWRLLSAKEFGFPQLRERVFIVAHNDRRYCRASGPAETKTRPANVLIDRTIEAPRMGRRRSIMSQVDSAVYGVPGIVDQLRGFGNAVIPDKAEWIGQQIMEAHDGNRISTN